MTRTWLLAAILGFAFAQAAQAARPIDCTTPISKAQKSIDKITGDLQGMEKMMAKGEMGHIHGLVGTAKKLLDEARQDCGKTDNPYDRARAIARAESADGYATAADILHFHYMQATSGGGMKDMKMGKSMGGMQNKH